MINKELTKEIVSFKEFKFELKQNGKNRNKMTHLKLKKKKRKN